jgi:hypothetical protein
MNLAIKITHNGQIGRMFPSEECRFDGETDASFFARIAAKDCPEGATWEVIDEKDFPPSPPPPAPPQPTLAELQAQLEALAAQITAMKQST